MIIAAQRGDDRLCQWDAEFVEGYFGDQIDEGMRR